MKRRTEKAHPERDAPFAVRVCERKPDQGFTTEASTTVPLNGVLTFSGRAT